MNGWQILMLCSGIFLVIACLIAALFHCASFIARCRESEREIRRKRPDPEVVHASSAWRKMTVKNSGTRT